MISTSDKLDAKADISDKNAVTLELKDTIEQTKTKIQRRIYDYNDLTKIVDMLKKKRNR